MGILGFLKDLFFPGVGRDISRLDSVGEADLAVAETVDLSGGPVKAGHRRRALRDRRLLPKKKKRSLRLFSRKKGALIPAPEARRLFSPTLRTRDRRLRDLLPDEEQLARLGLPVWRAEEDIAVALGIPGENLRTYSIHRERARVSHYVAFERPKRSGGARLILAPKKRLKSLQRRLLDLVVSKLPISEHAHGFVKGRSIRTGAEPHVGKAVVIRMDLKDFFGSVHFGRVRGLLVACGYGFPVATVLAVLMTEAPRQPVVIEGVTYHVPVGSRYCVQGAPTSPALCNAVVAKLDRRLAGLARALNFVYTRYADDLTFSGNAPERVPRFLTLVRHIAGEEGFAINENKTQVMRRGQRQRVTGVTVNRVLGLSRKERRLLRAEIHRNGATSQAIAGKLAYVRMLNSAQADAMERGNSPG